MKSFSSSKDSIHSADRSRKVELKDMVRLLGEEKMDFTIAGTGILVSSVCSLAIPTIFGNVIDALASGVEVGQVLQTSAIELSSIALLNGLATFVK